MEGEWAFTAVPDGGCRTSLTHTVAYVTDDGADRGQYRRDHPQYARTAGDRPRRRGTAGGASFARHLVHRHRLHRRRVQDAYAFLHDAGACPERLPHVAALSLEEPAPGVQFFDMTTAAPDGSEHTTRSVRITLAPRLIVYKQLVPPALLSAHTRHWSFVETPERARLCAAHDDDRAVGTAAVGRRHDRPRRATFPAPRFERTQRSQPDPGRGVRPGVRASLVGGVGCAGCYATGSVAVPAGERSAWE